ncbi:MAG: adenylate kinase [Ferrimicrobium sp.]
MTRSGAVCAIRFVLLGRQGAGKGTQCVRISHRFAIAHISTGDMLRAAVRAGTPFGTMAKGFMEAGELVPDEVITGVVSERLAEPDARIRGFVLDGFPRSLNQAKALQELLMPSQLSVVVNLDVEVDLVLARLASRRVCSVCGANYSVSLPPKNDWACDVCGGEVIQRDDDTVDAIQRRLDLYESVTAPVLAYYDSLGLLETVDGVGEPDEVLARVIDSMRRHGVKGIDGDGS